MATIHSSMKHDMEAAKNAPSKPADKPGKLESAPVGIFPEKALPPEEEKLMLEPAEEKLAYIADDYIGNISYKRFKDDKEEISVAEKIARQDAVFAGKPETGTPAEKALSAEEEERRQETEKVLSYMKEIKEDKIPAADEADDESGNFQKDVAGIKKELSQRLGKKGLAGVAMLAILLVAGTFYLLWSRKSGEEAAMDGKNIANQSEIEDANLPPVSEDVSKIADHNDATRISTLTTLANIAVLYHIEHGADLPVSRNYIKLNESNPVTDFLRDALRRYAKSEDLIHDPRNPDFYYAYRSADGNSVEFTARLEDPASSSDCKNEDVCIYKKVLSGEDIDGMSDHVEKYRP